MAGGSFAGLKLGLAIRSFSTVTDVPESSVKVKDSPTSSTRKVSPKPPKKASRITVAPSGMSM